MLGTYTGVAMKSGLLRRILVQGIHSTVTASWTLVQCSNSIAVSRTLQAVDRHKTHKVVYSSHRTCVLLQCQHAFLQVA